MNIQIVKHWNKYLQFFTDSNKDIYFSEEYVRLYESKIQDAACCVAIDGDKIMLFPFLRRNFEYEGKLFHDFETVYGYGGPIYNLNDDSFKNLALQLMYDEFKRNDYIAGFVRFHPLLRNYKQFNIGNVFEDRRTVAIDLSMDSNQILMQEIHTKNRNIIRKGEKNGLQFIVDDEYLYLNEFIRLYNATMDKLHASDFYYFNPEYFRSFINTIPNSFLGLVVYEGKVLSAAIFMYDGSYGHYHLSGSDINEVKLSPNNFLLWKAALELKRRGVKTFHLGGGTTSSEEDTLYRFKKHFSKHTYMFCLGKLIFDEKKYSSICSNWEQNNPEKVGMYKNFHLKYKY